MSDIPLPVAILAGGLATRLRPITETIPKALVPVNGRPFLAHQLELLKKQGFEKVVLCVGYLGDQIVDEIGDGQDYELLVTYSPDGEKLQGTAGALRKALPLLGDAFFVLYGDSYLEINYRAVYKAFYPGSGRALMTVIENSSGTENSNVHYKEGKILKYDKRHRGPEMNYIDYGLSAYPAHVFHDFPDADLSDVQRHLAEMGRMDGYAVTVPYHEIGSHFGLAALEKHLSQQSIK